MKYHSLATLLIIQLIATINFAQVSEISYSFIGINSINQLSNEGDKNDPLKSFWSPAFVISGEYTRSIAIGSVGMSSTASIEYDNKRCEGCTTTSGASYGTSDLGLQLGIGKRFYIGQKNSIDLFGGGLMRWIFKSSGGGSGGRYNDVVQMRLLFDEEYILKGNIHPGLYAKASWPFYSGKKNNFSIRLTLMYAQGLAAVYKNHSTIRYLQENKEYNYVLVNRGSFFGAGLIFSLKTSAVRKLLLYI
jgi:hypothetical protein